MRDCERCSKSRCTLGNNCLSVDQRSFYSNIVLLRISTVLINSELSIFPDHHFRVLFIRTYKLPDMGRRVMVDSVAGGHTRRVVGRPCPPPVRVCISPGCDSPPHHPHSPSELAIVISLSYTTITHLRLSNERIFVPRICLQFI
jgi:hypothetical protein